MTEAFVADLHHFMAAHDVPLVHFAKSLSGNWFMVGAG
jgi:hypothetical protein